MGLWISLVKIPERSIRESGTEWGKYRVWRYPPSPHPRNGLLGAGFAKIVCKILIADGLEVKILTTNGLGLLSWSSPILPSPRP